MAKLKEFKAEYGLSVQIKDQWHRLSCAVTIEIEPGDNSVDIKRKAWETVDQEIDNQVNAILENQ